MEIEEEEEELQDKFDEEEELQDKFEEEQELQDKFPPPPSSAMDPPLSPLLEEEQNEKVEEDDQDAEEDGAFFGLEALPELDDKNNSQMEQDMGSEKQQEEEEMENDMESENIENEKPLEEEEEEEKKKEIPKSQMSYADSMIGFLGDNNSENQGASESQVFDPPATVDDPAVSATEISSDEEGPAPR